MSDWSSDVCSSDLLGHVQLAAAAEPCHPLQIGRVAPDLVAVVAPERRRQPPAAAEQLVGIADHQRVDRKRVVQGKNVSVRLDLGGRRLIKNNMNNHNTQSTNQNKNNWIHDY